MNTTSSHRVLITDRFDTNASALLRSDSRLNISVSENPVPTAEELRHAEALIIRSRTPISRELLAQAPHLRVIVTATSGFNHIDLQATQERGVAVMFTPNANAASACELTWTLALACSRRLIEAHRAVKAGDWRREALIGRELQQKTYGVIGLGRIGTRVARVAQAFGMRAIAYDPYKEEAHFAAAGVERVSYEELLKLSDIISFHVPATEETKHMLTLTHFEYMHRGAILINTSRGAVMREVDLIEALNNGWIAACGLDVFEREPLPRHSGLLNRMNVVLSPHLGATTSEAFAAASREAAEKIIAFLTNGSVSDPLPPKEPWYESAFARPMVNRKD